MQGLRIAAAIFLLVTLAACQALIFASPQPAPMPGVEVETNFDYVTLSTEEATPELLPTSPTPALSLAATRPPILDVFPLEMGATWAYSVTLDY